MRHGHGPPRLCRSFASAEVQEPDDGTHTPAVHRTREVQAWYSVIRQSCILIMGDNNIHKLCCKADACTRCQQIKVLWHSDEQSSACAPCFGLSYVIAVKAPLCNRG